MIGQISLNTWNQKFTQSLPRCSMYLLGHAFDTQPGHWQAWLKPSLLACTDHQVCQRWELRAFSVFCKHVHSPIHATWLAGFQDDVRAFKAMMNISFHSFAFFCCCYFFVLLIYCLHQLLFSKPLPPVSCEVKQLPLIVFNNYPQGKELCIVWDMGQIKWILQMGSPRKLPDRSNNNCLGMRL